MTDDTTHKLLADGVVTLRALEPTDLDLLYQWENDTALWTVTDTMAPYSRKLIWQYLNQFDGDVFQACQLRLMVGLQATGATIGTADLMHIDAFNSRAEVGLCVARQWQGQGYGHRALALLIDYAHNHLGLHQLYVNIPVFNTACLQLFDDCGFTLAGTLKSWIRRGRRYHDVNILQHIC